MTDEREAADALGDAIDEIHRLEAELTELRALKARLDSIELCPSIMPLIGGVATPTDGTLPEPGCWSRAAILSEMDDEVAELRAEVERLQRWKQEANYIIDTWEKVWVAAGQPGPVGGLRSENVAAEFSRLKALETKVLSAHPTRMPGEWSAGWDACVSWLLTP